MSTVSYHAERNWGCRASLDRTYRGWSLVSLENELIRVEVLAGKGADIVEFLHKPTDTDFTWRSRLGVRPRSAVMATPSTLSSAFLDSYEGGWQEVFPSGGVSCSYLGAELQQHAEVSILPWSVELTEDSPDKTALRFEVQTPATPFRLQRTIALRTGDPCLYLSGSVRNEGNVAVDFMWGQHLAFGQPFLDESCRIAVPTGTRYSAYADAVFPTGRRISNSVGTWPHAVDAQGNPVDLSHIPPRGTPSELLYLHDMETGWYRITNGDKAIALEVRWNIEHFPYLWFWQEFGGGVTYPWWGAHYNIGLEPFTSPPRAGLAGARVDGTSRLLEAGERFESSWSYRVVEQEMLS